MPELLVVTMLSIVVFGALIQPMITGPRVAKRDINRTYAIQSVQGGLYRMTRELRQTQQVFSATSSALDVRITLGGVTQRVLYDCSYQPGGSTYRQCRRAVTTCNGNPVVCPTTPTASSGKVVIDRILNGTTGGPTDPIFPYTPNASTPTYVSARVIVPASAGQAGAYKGGAYGYQIYLDDGAYMRNLGTQ